MLETPYSAPLTSVDLYYKWTINFAELNKTLNFSPLECIAPEISVFSSFKLCFFLGPIKSTLCIYISVAR